LVDAAVAGVVEFEAQRVERARGACQRLVELVGVGPDPFVQEGDLLLRA
jgi:hypothetical protein